MAVTVSTVATVGPVAADGVVRQVAAEVDHARGPSLSDDGRWLVFGGRIGERATVFSTDLASDTTVELSLVPETVRAGDTVHARISPDGCVVVAISEVAFDLFRDDDRDDRWDVYRLGSPSAAAGRIPGSTG